MERARIQQVLSVSQWAVPVGAALCIVLPISSAGALIFGMVVALTIGNPYLEQTRRLSLKLLTWSVVGLGAGMNLSVIARVGLHGVGYTGLGITLTLVIGLILAHWMRTDRETGLLIAAGTAICGGSAIAAVGAVLNAKPQKMTVALATVFLLNSAALFFFPAVGHWFGLTETQFGTWAALAIHDTSSVVAASLSYGPIAAEVGTTIKLARSLWIIPVAMLIGMLSSKELNPSAASKVKRPWFILWFLLAAAIVTFIPVLKPVGSVVELVARKGLVLTLFLIGCGTTMTSLRSVGLRPFLHGLILWALVAPITLWAVHLGWIN